MTQLHSNTVKMRTDQGNSDSDEEHNSESWEQDCEGHSPTDRDLKDLSAYLESQKEHEIKIVFHPELKGVWFWIYKNAKEKTLHDFYNNYKVFFPEEESCYFRKVDSKERNIVSGTGEMGNAKGKPIWAAVHHFYYYFSLTHPNVTNKYFSSPLAQKLQKMSPLEHKKVGIVQKNFFFWKSFLEKAGFKSVSEWTNIAPLFECIDNLSDDVESITGTISSLFSRLSSREQEACLVSLFKENGMPFVTVIVQHLMRQVQEKLNSFNKNVWEKYLTSKVKNFLFVKLVDLLTKTSITHLREGVTQEIPADYVVTMLMRYIKHNIDHHTKETVNFNFVESENGCTIGNLLKLIKLIGFRVAIYEGFVKYKKVDTMFIHVHYDGFPGYTIGSLSAMNNGMPF